MATSIPTTSELRAWAQANGIDVAERGRISAAVLAAWVAAHDTDVSVTDTSTAPPTVAEVVAATPVELAPTDVVIDVTDDVADEVAVSGTHEPDDGRLTDLERQVAELRQRVSQLEQQAAQPRRGLFRRS